MTEKDVAANYLEVTVDVADYSRRKSGIKWLWAALLAHVVGDFSAAIPRHVAVVRYRSSSEDVLRIDGGDGNETALLVTRIERDLAEMSLEEFLVEWNAPAS